MKASTLIVALFLATSTTGFSQYSPEKKEVLDVIQNFFNALQKRDTAAFIASTLAEVQTPIVMERNDSVFVRVRSRAAFIKSLAEGTTVIDEKMRNKGVVVEVHDRIAMVWAPYDLWIDKKFSHCGVDVFTLIKTKDGWKISALAYTIEREGCGTK